MVLIDLNIFFFTTNPLCISEPEFVVFLLPECFWSVSDCRPSRDSELVFSELAHHWLYPLKYSVFSGYPKVLKLSLYQCWL